MQDFLTDIEHGTLDPRLVRSLREAQQAFVARPQIPIRLRFAVSLALCFLLCVAFAFATLDALNTIRTRLGLIEVLERIAFQVERARAIETSGAGGGESLRQARAHLSEAVRTVRAHSERLGRAAGLPEFSSLTNHLAAYDELLASAAGGAPDTAALRGHGREASRRLAVLIEREKRTSEQMFAVWERAPLVLLGVLFVLFALIAMLFGRALVGPIRRFQAYTRRIADGDFTLLVPTRRYRDEFSELALAVNRMLAELQANQDRCVKAGKLAAVGTITSGIAHELNNPLNNISITTEALMEEWAEMGDEEKWKLLQDVYFETERASEIVKSLLDFTRHERPELVKIDIADVIQSTFRLTQNEMTLSDIDFNWDLPGELPPAWGAANQLRQVFLNLFLNAIQAMPRGGRLTVSASSDEPGRVCIEVTDTGSGIPPDVLPHIFDPFFTTKEPGQGTGLGLSVSSSIIKKLGGEIHVTSEVGRGTTFHVCLPLATGS